MKKCITCALTGTLIISAGCFTSDGPVYEDSQVFQDKRIEGEFDNGANFSKGPSPKKDGSIWMIAASPEEKGKYEVWVKEGNAQIDLRGTLFRLGSVAFLDLYPLRDSGMYHVGGDPPTVTEIIHTTMFQRRHIIWKVELSDSEVTYWFPFGNGVTAALKKAPELKHKSDNDASLIILPESQKEAQSYLRQFATNSDVFNYKGQLIRKKQPAESKPPK
jgi:hypothetical protein